MKMLLGNTPVNSLNVHHYNMDTNDCTMVASDLQAGVTAVARGQKITGTGKCFSFASYGDWMTNESDFVPMTINTVLIGSIDYPVRMIAKMMDMRHYDFSSPKEVAEAIVDGVNYPISVSVQDGELLITCEKTINIQLFIGKDEYL